MKAITRIEWQDIIDELNNLAEIELDIFDPDVWIGYDFAIKEIEKRLKPKGIIDE